MNINLAIEGILKKKAGLSTMNQKFDDVIKDEDGTCCINKYGMPEKYLDNAGSGICGVDGCQNEADFYIDFSGTHKVPEKSKYSRPECYEAEKNNPYPLCVGNGKPECETCCLYTDLPGPYDDY